MQRLVATRSARLVATTVAAYLASVPLAGARMTPSHPAAAGEANRLYWESEDSVAEIADRLDLSRRALYELIEPLPTGAACDVCGGPLSFENRSARTAGDATCVICAETGATDEDSVTNELPGVTPFDVEARERALLVGGAAVAGAAMGALLTFALVPRR
jgi:hypothetical protein